MDDDEGELDYEGVAVATASTLAVTGQCRKPENRSWYSKYVEACRTMERPTFGASEPRAFAAAKYAANVLSPVVGALIALRKRHHQYTTSRKRENNKFESAQTRPFRDHNGPGLCRKTRWLSHEVVTSKEKEVIRCLLTFLVVCDLDAELFPGLQTRIKTRSIRVIQIHTRIVEGTSRHGVKN